MSKDNNGFLPLPKGYATSAIHEGQQPENWTHNEVIVPISLTNCYKQEEPGVTKKYLYSRLGNPTRETLEKVLAKLDLAEHAVCFGSGVGAITTLLALLKTGDHIVASEDLYGGTTTLFTQIAPRNGIETTFVDNDIGSFEKAIRANTKMIFVETPSNPVLNIYDLNKLSKLAKKHDLLLTVDNTFLTSYLQRPLQFGVDIVMYSLTKYTNGHSDVCMGALVTNDHHIGERLQYLQTAMGVIPSPFDCYQVLRGLKTLPLRMRQHSKNSLVIANHLEGHPKIEKLLHPALPSHSQHELAKKQTSGHSGIIGLYIKGDIEASRIFLRSLKIFTTAGSLGHCESLATLNAVISHSNLSQEKRQKLGITDNFIRLSIGLEDTEDLIADLEYALAQI